MTPAPGARVGEWVLDERLGAGGFGEVWRAHAEADPARVAALKLPRDDRGEALLRREGALQARLPGGRFPRVLGVHLDPPVHAAFELVDGESLRGVLAARGALPPAEAVTLGAGVLEALEVAHAAGVLHRDLKPENVLVARDGRVLVTDLGLGLPCELEHSLEGEEAVAAAGSAPYLAPEVRERRPADARVDLYAWGVLLFEALTGRLPGAAELPSRARPGVPAALDAVYRRACARREARHGSAAEARADLLRAAAAAGLAPAPVRLEDPPPAAPAPARVDVRALLERVAAEERAFLAREFTAFVTPEGRATARVRGKSWTFDVAGPPGLAVLVAESPTRAKVVRRHTALEPPA